MKKIILLIVIFGVFIFLPINRASAHWEYIFGYPYWVYDPPAAPKTTGTWKFLANNDGTYDVLLTWADSTTRRYSLGMSKYAGADPGPNADTYARVWIFHNISPGKWYINMKFEVSGQWSQVAYWTVDIPEWIAPTNAPEVPTATTTSNGAISFLKDVSRYGVLIEFGSILFIIYSIYGLATSKNRKKTIEKRKILIAGTIVLIVTYLGTTWINTPINQRCSRNSPYSMQPEFQRAISLIEQRYSQAFGQSNDTRGSIYNCLDIQYQNLGNGLEGEFIFDKNSTTDDLKIFVNDNYKANDDILTAILLNHELTHAMQFVDKSELSCMDMETNAFQNEYNFLFILNAEEKSSLISRITLNPEGNTSYGGILNLLEFTRSARNQDQIRELVKTMVENEPYYQQQCENKPSPTYSP